VRWRNALNKCRSSFGCWKPLWKDIDVVEHRCEQFEVGGGVPVAQSAGEALQRMHYRPESMVFTLDQAP